MIYSVLAQIGEHLVNSCPILKKPKVISWYSVSCVDEKMGQIEMRILISLLIHSVFLFSIRKIYEGYY